MSDLRRSITAAHLASSLSPEAKRALCWFPDSMETVDVKNAPSLQPLATRFGNPERYTNDLMVWKELGKAHLTPLGLEVRKVLVNNYYLAELIAQNNHQSKRITKQRRIITRLLKMRSRAKQRQLEEDNARLIALLERLVKDLVNHSAFTEILQELDRVRKNKSDHC